MKKISIIIPVLNESQNIYKLTKKIREVFKNNIYEVIFVDDNSDDNSLEYLKKCKKKFTNFNYIIRKEINRDLTQSCILGIKKSKYPFILIMDGDLQHNPIYILKMLKKLEKDNLDIVVGIRDFDKTEKISLSAFRLFLSQAIKLVFFSIFEKKTLDPMAGFFLFKKSIFIKNQKLLYGYGFKILADIIYNIKDLKVGDVVINFNSRNKGKSKMNFKVIVQIIYLIIFCLTKKFLRLPIRIK